MRRDGRMAELVDAPDSKSSSSNAVWVRFPLRPPKNQRSATCEGLFFILLDFVYVIIDRTRGDE